MVPVTSSTDQSSDDTKGLQTSLIVIQLILWSAILCFTLYNGYIYLIKLRKYRFIPSLLLYFGMVSLCIVVITYFGQRINPSSPVNIDESTWLYYSGNIRLFCIVSIIGFCALIIELLLMLRLMTKSSEQLIYAQREWRTHSSASILQKKTQGTSKNNSSRIKSGESLSMDFDIQAESFANDTFLDQPKLVIKRALAEHHGLLAKNTKHTRILEWSSLSFCILLAVIYNVVTFIVAYRVTHDNVMTNAQFYQDESVMAAYKAFLYINCAFTLLVWFLLATATYMLIQNLKSYFKGQFRKEQWMVTITTIVFLMVSVLALLNDIYITAIQLGDDVQVSDDSDGILSTCFVLWVPLFVIDVLHFFNLRQDEDLPPQEAFNGLLDSSDKRFRERNKSNKAKIAEKDQNKERLEAIPSETEQSQYLLPSNSMDQPESSLPQSTVKTSYDRPLEFLGQQESCFQSSFASESLSTGFQQAMMLEYKSSTINSAMSNGLLVANNVLFQRHALICQAQFEEADASSSNSQSVIQSQKMSNLTIPQFVEDSSFAEDEKLRLTLQDRSFDQPMGNNSFNDVANTAQSTGLKQFAKLSTQNRTDSWRNPVSDNAPIGQESRGNQDSRSMTGKRIMKSQIM